LCENGSIERAEHGNLLADPVATLWKRHACDPQTRSVLAVVPDGAVRMKSAPLRAQKVLLVDDEELVRKFVDRVLRDAGYQTTTASDGAEAIAAAATETFDVLVTDVMMPQMRGDELARRVRITTPEIKVLYLTGFSDQLFKEKVTLWADEAFLDKPCSVKGLLQAVSLLVFGRLKLPQEHRS
jgi:CheY-like chemotaxis protein